MARNGSPVFISYNNAEQFAGEQRIILFPGNKNADPVPKMMENLRCWNRSANPVPQMVENLLCWNKKANPVPKTTVGLISAG